MATVEERITQLEEDVADLTEKLDEYYEELSIKLDDIKRGYNEEDD